jgi:hypothetical protein
MIEQLVYLVIHRAYGIINVIIDAIFAFAQDIVAVYEQTILLEQPVCSPLGTLGHVVDLKAEVVPVNVDLSVTLLVEKIRAQDKTIVCECCLT